MTIIVNEAIYWQRRRGKSESMYCIEAHLLLLYTRGKFRVVGVSTASNHARTTYRLHDLTSLTD
jgi:hypothetical protein